MNEVEFKSKYNYQVATPMMQQYLDIKLANQDSLLLFRMGDFYELFFDDAVTASQVLGLALAKRGKHGEDDLQMCGMPYHALEPYLQKLVEEGFKVAICEQMETPEEAKKRGYKAVVRREIVRIITPGTITEESILETTNPNYLISIRIAQNIASIAYLDVSTSEFNIVSIGIENLANEIAKIDPKEILISEKDSQTEHLRNWQQKMVVQVESYFSTSKCQNIIEHFYNIQSYKAIGSLTDTQISAIGAVLEYINITQKQNLPALPLPHIVNASDFMIIDASTRRNLELTHNVHGSHKGSLLHVINKTVTKSGARTLYQFLSSPLTNLEQINNRHDKVEFFVRNIHLTEKIRHILKNTGDLERILTKISMKRCIPRDLMSIYYSLEAASDIQAAFVSALGIEYPPVIQDILQTLGGNDEISDKIFATIKEDAPNSLADGGFIKTSYHPKLKELYDLLENNNDVMEKLKIEYQRTTGIDNLKICHNNIMGLFIEVTPKNVHKITSSEFIHKQTLASAVRFTTDKLKVIENEMLSAKSTAIAFEQQIFWKLCDYIIENAGKLHLLAFSLSQLDAFTSLAYLADEYGYIRPEMTSDNSFNIMAGRHVVVEQSLKSSKFIPNDCDLSASRLWLLTGPNMAGKSTFLRQNALIIILAQMGSFVPANFAQIGIVDRLFSRIGASDDLAKGQSTFMVEMLETATILAQSTEKSFIILDEVGRGTSTYDGVSIAWATLEHIHDKLKCRSLFATHYHELTILSESLPALKNYTIKIAEENGEVLFLHQIIAGSANKSYGIHVAEIAGLPNSVIKRAYQILSKLEKTSSAQNKKLESITTNNYSLFEYNQPFVTKEANTNVIASDNNCVAISALEKALSEINPDNLSPKEALEELYKLKKL